MKRSVKLTLIWVPVSLLILFLLTLTVIPALVMHSMLDQKVSYDRMWDPKDYSLEADTVNVVTEDGFKINFYEVCPENPKMVIICLTGIEKPSVTAYYGHAKMFFNHGYASLLVDVRGHGESDGDRICCAYEETRDVKAVTEYINNKKEYDGIPVVIYGLSMGAGIAINSIAENDDIDALVSISAFSSFEDMFADYMGSQVPNWLANIEKPFVQLISVFKYGVNPLKVRPKTSIRHLEGRPALLMHTKEDSNVYYSNFERIMKNAPAGVQTLTRDIDEHFFSPDFFNPQLDSLYSQKVLDFLKSI